MKPAKKYVLISCFVMMVFLLTASFPGISIAEEEADEKTTKRINKCIVCCNNKFLVCINLNPDRRLCAAEQEPCVTTCKSEGVTSSEWSECWAQAKDEEP